MVSQWSVLLQMRLLGTDDEVSVFPNVIFEDGMTAIAIVGVSAGFIVAADGRMSPVDEAAPQETLSLVSDNKQKIFEISDPQKNLAYAVVGWVIDPSGFDLLAVIRSQVNGISPRRFDDCRQYLRSLADKINIEINNAKQDGTLAEFPRVTHVEQSTTAWKFAAIYIAGYFDKIQVLYRIEFVHYSGDCCECDVIPYPNPIVISGSRTIRREMYRDDGLPVAGSRFSEYVKELGLAPSLDDAEEYAVGYVKACCSPLAIDLDAGCKAMGGHIHVAEITPAGMKWRIPPATHNY